MLGSAVGVEWEHCRIRSSSLARLKCFTTKFRDAYSTHSFSTFGGKREGEIDTSLNKSYLNIFLSFQDRNGDRKACSNVYYRKSNRSK